MKRSYKYQTTIETIYIALEVHFKRNKAHIVHGIGKKKKKNTHSWDKIMLQILNQKAKRKKIGGGI